MESDVILVFALWIAYLVGLMVGITLTDWWHKQKRKHYFPDD